MDRDKIYLGTYVRCDADRVGVIKKVVDDVFNGGYSFLVYLANGVSVLCYPHEVEPITKREYFAKALKMKSE